MHHVDDPTILTFSRSPKDTCDVSHYFNLCFNFRNQNDKVRAEETGRIEQSFGEANDGKHAQRMKMKKEEQRQRPFVKIRAWRLGT